MKLLKGKWSAITVPVLSVALGLLVGGMIMLVSGYNPIVAYAALFNGIFSNSYVLGETVRQMTPLILSGLAVAFAFRTGLFNIGVEGQLLVGWLASVYVGLQFEGLSPLVHIPLAILAAGVAGAMWAFVPGFLKAKYHVHEVITTIMMNYVALHVVNAIIRTYLLAPGERTDQINQSASLQSSFLQTVTDFSRLHYGFVVAIIGAIIMWFLLWKTTTGYELRSVGFNKYASEYAGINVQRNIILSMVISGAFAGAAGAMEGLGTYGYMTVMADFTGVGFDGIAVALLGANSAFGVVLASALFGGLKIGALNMQSVAQVPTQLVEIVIAMIIFFVASSYLIHWISNRVNKRGKI
ncbi:ABC transporter permease [Guptibacillus hwajinpoensis]|uniref:Branched-chain amino acid ABC transporter permease n=1 Tax=Guptibacillus hwajinpoensis TaxID=208199 RepID=A0A0J6CQV7_9BACL|nr:ABC transporter permease [Alkalihalobacillus macyae]KMM38651.1 branched-chain amino acid ABC transporter permease [Alkalihalobacillus macyae]